jgi:hypothetical protein
MNAQEIARVDWEVAQASGNSLVMVAERGLLPAEQRQQLCTEHPVWHLLEQPEVKHLRAEGPVLIELSDQPFGRQAQLHEQLSRSALHGWLCSALRISDLRKHLGDALACRDVNGDTLLIRSYAHNVLPALYARHDLPWHTWLFGPIGQWWLPTRQGWRRLDGLALDSVPLYQPIALDQRLADELGIDQHAQALVAELQRQAPEVFTSECHGERLNQVGQALSQARQAGLSQTQDQYFFALYSLLSGKPMHQNKDWPAILHRVEKLGQELAQVRLPPDEGA